MNCSMFANCLHTELRYTTSLAGSSTTAMMYSVLSCSVSLQLIRLPAHVCFDHENVFVQYLVGTALRFLEVLIKLIRWPTVKRQSRNESSLSDSAVMGTFLRLLTASWPGSSWFYSLLLCKCEQKYSNTFLKVTLFLKLSVLPFSFLFTGHYASLFKADTDKCKTISCF